MATNVTGRADASEYAPYAKGYVDLVRGDDLLYALAAQLAMTSALLKSIDDRCASTLTYETGKWTPKQVLGHVVDTERIFAYRALHVARQDSKPLPGFDQEHYADLSGSNNCAWLDLLEEFRAVRNATVVLFRNLPADAWSCRGTVNGFDVTVRGLGFHIAGHELHHVKILREKYL